MGHKVGRFFWPLIAFVVGIGPAIALAAIPILTGSIVVPASGSMTLNQVAGNSILCTNASHVVGPSGCNAALVFTQGDIRGVATDFVSATSAQLADTNAAGIASDGTSIYASAGGDGSPCTFCLTKWTGSGLATDPPFGASPAAIASITDTDFQSPGIASMAMGSGVVWAASGHGAGSQNYIISFDSTSLATGTKRTISDSTCGPSQLQYDTVNSLVYFDCAADSRWFKMTTAGAFTAIATSVAHNTMTYGPDGNFWLATSSPSVLVYSAAGSLVATYNSGNVTGFPAAGTCAGITFDGSGNPWVLCATSTPTVSLYSLDSATPTTATAVASFSQTGTRTNDNIKYVSGDNSIYGTAPSGSWFRYSITGAAITSMWADAAIKVGTTRPLDIASVGVYGVISSNAQYGDFLWLTPATTSTNTGKTELAIVGSQFVSSSSSGATLGKLVTIQAAFTGTTTGQCIASSPGQAGVFALAYSSTQVFLGGFSTNPTGQAQLICTGT